MTMKTKAMVGVVLALPLMAAAETKTWVAVLDPEGTATTASAAVAENWDPAGIPTAEDDIVLDGERSNVPLVWNVVVAEGTGAPTSVKSWTQKESYTARVTMPTTRSGAFTQFTVTGDAQLDGGEWWRAGNIKDDKSNAKVWLNIKVGGAMTVGPGFRFNGYNAGYCKQQGYSTGTSSSGGAAHGGLGGSGYGYGTAYGDYRQPTTLGSGAYGSNDNAGGGSIVLAVNGALVLDGLVSADGGDGTDSAGASGGSLWITAKSLSGTGTITAEGGSPGQKRIGGGGGRIAIYVTDKDIDYAAFNSRFTGTITARGGYPSLNGSYVRTSGGAGTVYVETVADNGKGHMILGNGNWEKGKGTGVNFEADTPINSGVVWDLTSLDMKVNGHVGILPGGTLKVPSFAAITGDGSACVRLHLRGGALVSAIKHDTLVADKFGLMVTGENSLAEYFVVVPETSKLNVAGTLTVGNLKLNGVKLAKGTYSSETLAETYANVSGEGTIGVLGLEKGLTVIVR